VVPSGRGRYIDTGVAQGVVVAAQLVCSLGFGAVLASAGPELFSPEDFLPRRDLFLASDLGQPSLSGRNPCHDHLDHHGTIGRLIPALPGRWRRDPRRPGSTRRRATRESGAAGPRYGQTPAGSCPYVAGFMVGHRAAGRLGANPHRQPWGPGGSSGRRAGNPRGSGHMGKPKGPSPGSSGCGGHSGPPGASDAVGRQC
jgi:hypothetical protein